MFKIPMTKSYIVLITGLLILVSFRFSEDKGRMLENIVNLHLKRKGYKVFYFYNKRECDFVIQEGMKIRKVIQVTYELNSNNREREFQGLLEAMKYFKLKNGIIFNK